jgi:hypothetical protein
MAKKWRRYKGETPRFPRLVANHDKLLLVPGKIIADTHMVGLLEILFCFFARIVFGEEVLVLFKFNGCHVVVV